MFVNTTRLQATGEHLSYWSHPICGHIWRYTKFTTNGGIFKSLKPPNMWQGFKIPQDCRPRGKIWIIEAPQYFAAAQYLAIFENTTRLSETGKSFYLLKPPNISQCLKISQDWRPRGGNLRYWSHPIFCHIWKYNKIFSREEIFELLKTPNMWQYSRIPQDCRPLGKAWLLKPPNDLDFWRYHKIASNGENSIYWSHQKGNVQRVKFKLFNLKPPTRQCLKIPQDCRPRTKYFARFEKTTRYPATGTFKSLKQPNMRQCLKIPQDCSPGGKI